MAGGQRGTVSIGIVFIGGGRMRSLNHQYAGNDYVTDVLSFPALEGKQPGSAGLESDLGDIFICLPQAAKQALGTGHTLDTEVDMLLAHGVLHLMGYDHDTPRRRKAMDRAQAFALAGR